MAENKKNSRKHIFPQQNLILVENGRRLVMESVRHILFCDESKIVLESRFRLEILGEGLVLEELGNDNMAVIGTLHTLHFSEVRK